LIFQNVPVIPVLPYIAVCQSTLAYKHCYAIAMEVAFIIPCPEYNIVPSADSFFLGNREESGKT